MSKERKICVQIIYMSTGDVYNNSKAPTVFFIAISFAQRHINLEIPVLVRSLKSSNVELGLYLDGTLFKCCLSAAANP